MSLAPLLVDEPLPTLERKRQALIDDGVSTFSLFMIRLLIWQSHLPSQSIGPKGVQC